MLHSLVRVSRRVGCSHLSTNNLSARRGRPPTEQTNRQRTLHAVPTAGPKRKEATRPRRAYAARVRIHDSPQSLPDHRTNGCTFSAASAEAPPDRPSGPGTTAVGRLHTGVQGCRRRLRAAAPRATATRHILRRPLNPNRSHFSCIRFPPNGFAVFLTLFSKYFSPFPHGTCSLSVSCRYLALDGVYHPLWAAFPNNPTLRRR